VGPRATSTSRVAIRLRLRRSFLPLRLSFSTTVRRVPVGTVVLPLPIAIRRFPRPFAVSFCVVAAADGLTARASRSVF
jgi:hypothetical protein